MTYKEAMAEFRKTNKRDDPHMCPVCGKFEFPYHGSDEFCKVCGWQDDFRQEIMPDETVCENLMSLNEAREAYTKGEKAKATAINNK